MKDILIINGHPDSKSYVAALTDAYEKGAVLKAKKVERIDLAKLDFNPNLAYGYRKVSPLEPDLQETIEKINRAEHIVWLFPVWWYGYPALMKGFIDRIFLPGIAFKYNGKPVPDKLWKGKSGHIILTADTPRWYSRLFMKDPAINQMKKGTLQFSGISPVKVTYISPVKDSSDAFRSKWLEKVRLMGENLN
jgi:NAD(P)H dehydrogenase (quinone)